MIVPSLYGKQNPLGRLLLQRKSSKGRLWILAGNFLQFSRLFRFFAHFELRSWDGMTLYAASSDGTIAVFAFEQDELEGIAPHSVQEQYLSKFGFTPPPLPEGYSHMPSLTTNANDVSQPQSQSQIAGFDNSVVVRDEVVNVLVAKRNNKKRVGLTSVPSAGAPSSFAGKRASFLPGSADVKMSGGSKPTSPTSRDSFFPPPDEQPFENRSNWKSHGDVVMEDDSRPVYRTLGGDRQREMIPVKEINDSSVTAWRNHLGASSGLDLPVPPTLTRLTAEVEGTHVFEGLNPEDGGKSYSCANMRFVHLIVCFRSSFHTFVQGKTNAMA